VKKLSTYEKEKPTEQNIKEEREFRFIVTQECNYDCFFCHGEGVSNKKRGLLTPNDFNFIFLVGKEYFGHNHITITGGEPLCKKGIINIAKILFESGAKITLVTNGYFLDRQIEIGKYIERINISFHSTVKEKYESAVQKRNSYHKVINNIYLFRKTYPNNAIRLNSTIINNLNSKKEDILNLISFAEKIEASIKFIELFPPNSEKFISIKNIEKIITKENFELKFSQIRKNIFSNGDTDVGLSKITCAVASKQKNPSVYCKENNDLFITQDGNIKPCMNSNHQINILKETKNNDRIGLLDKIKEATNYHSRNCPLIKEKIK
jgi:cyclic pyranopterin phosphate synthase